MEVTIQFLTDSFKTFNQTYFNNKLLMPRFEITHVKSYLGQYHWEYSYDHRIFSDSVIRISDYYMRDETALQETLLHEMIHLYIRQNRITDTRPHHGKVFYSVANRLNREGGFNIACTNSVNGCGLRDKSKKETYYVACYKSGRSGRYFSFVINKNYLEHFQYLFKKYSQSYLDVFVFTSTDDKKYAHYPKCRQRVSGYYIDVDTFNKLRETENIISHEQTLGIKTKAA